MKSRIPLLGMVMGLALALQGCFFAVDHDAHDAIFTVEWRVDGSSHPDACWDFGAEYAFITVESRYGLETSRTVACERFGYDFYLAPGRYWVTVTLQDRHHDDITSVVETDSHTLYEGGGDYVVADFPPDSFL